MKRSATVQLPVRRAIEEETATARVLSLTLSPLLIAVGGSEAAYQIHIEELPDFHTFWILATALLWCLLQLAWSLAARKRVLANRCQPIVFRVVAGTNWFIIFTFTAIHFRLNAFGNYRADFEQSVLMFMVFCFMTQGGLSLKIGRVVTFLNTVVTMVLMFLPTMEGIPSQVHVQATPVVLYWVLVLLSGLAVQRHTYFVRRREHAARLRATHERMELEKLTLQLIPAHCAQAVRDDAIRRVSGHLKRWESDEAAQDSQVASLARLQEAATAETIREASVMFVGVGDDHDVACENQADAQRLVDRARRIVDVLDAIVADHDAEIVETLRDVHLIISTAGQRHMTVMSNIATRILSNHVLEPLHPKIGIHCGPMTAGLVGERVHWTVFGDTVNTASRLMSTSGPGKIQMSELAHEYLLKQRTRGLGRNLLNDLERRGSVNMKGIGFMETYWSDGSSESLICKRSPALHRREGAKVQPKSVGPVRFRIKDQQANQDNDCSTSKDAIQAPRISEGTESSARRSSLSSATTPARRMSLGLLQMEQVDINRDPLGSPNPNTFKTSTETPKPTRRKPSLLSQQRISKQMSLPLLDEGLPPERSALPSIPEDKALTVDASSSDPRFLGMTGSTPVLAKAFLPSESPPVPVSRKFRVSKKISPSKLPGNTPATLDSPSGDLVLTSHVEEDRRPFDRLTLRFLDPKTEASFNAADHLRLRYLTRYLLFFGVLISSGIIIVQSSLFSAGTTRMQLIFSEVHPLLMLAWFLVLCIKFTVPFHRLYTFVFAMGTTIVTGLEVYFTVPEMTGQNAFDHQLLVATSYAILNLFVIGLPLWPDLVAVGTVTVVMPLLLFEHVTPSHVGMRASALLFIVAGMVILSRYVQRNLRREFAARCITAERAKRSRALVSLLLPPPVVSLMFPEVDHPLENHTWSLARNLKSAFIFHNRISPAAYVVSKETSVDPESVDADITSLTKTVSGEERALALRATIGSSKTFTPLDRTKLVPADFYRSMSILHCDIAGFTNICQTLSSTAVLSLLNETFLAFDKVISKSRLCKLYTVGDAYAAGGMRENHGSDAVELGVQLLKCVRRLNSRRSSEFVIGVRIGVHTGWGVTGVVGQRRPVFLVWGECVSGAEVLEKTGVVDRVHISNATHVAAGQIGVTTLRGGQLPGIGASYLVAAPDTPPTKTPDRDVLVPYSI